MTSVVTISSATLASASLLLAPSSSFRDDSSYDSNQSVARSTLIGITVCAVTIALIGVIACGIWLYLRRRQRDRLPTGSFFPDGESSPGSAENEKSLIDLTAKMGETRQVSEPSLDAGTNADSRYFSFLIVSSSRLASRISTLVLNPTVARRAKQARL